MLTIATLLLAAGVTATPPAAAVPPEIDQHYREYNVVTAFSTASERHTIASGREAPDDPRLARVARLMRRLESQIEEVDPGIVAPWLRTGASTETAFRSDLVRITSSQVDADKGEAWIHLDVLALDRGPNVTLAGRYDALAGGGRTPSVAELLAATSGPRIRTEEIHRWTRVDGVWRRAAAALVFVAQ
jgi:hypothetical protein